MFIRVRVSFKTFLYGHVHFIYINRDFKPYRFSSPDYVCYDEQLCADFLPSTKRINGSTCRRLDEFELNTVNSINTMPRTT